jgi:hypothetical protein
VISRNLVSHRFRYFCKLGVQHHDRLCYGLGAVEGALDCSIQSIDEEAGHTQMVQISVIGVYAAQPNGTIWYMTYTVSGDWLYLLIQTGSYHRLRHQNRL